jgi:hypothetical protein
MDPVHVFVPAGRLPSIARRDLPVGRGGRRLPGADFLQNHPAADHPIIVTIVLIRIIDAFKLFELVFGITSAGPANATEALSYYIYQTGIKWFDLGKGAAMSWIFLLILMGISQILLSRFRERT